VFVVLHVSPEHPSALPSILSRAGPLPAAHASDGETIQHGRVYVAPPDQHLVIAREHVRLWQGPREDWVRPSINVLFRSAARTYGPSVVGVLLSGRLHDGTAGLMTVKARGGVTILQDPSDTLHPQMPLAAMAHAGADYVLPAAKIPPLLARLAQTPVVQRPRGRTEEEMRESQPQPRDLPPEEASVEAVASGLATGFVCPECGGALWEAFEGGLIHYHCHVGHVHAVEGLLNGQADTVERALWTAVRALEERAALLLRVAGQAREHGDEATAIRLEARVRAIETRATLARRALQDVLNVESPREA
jgi:two-component system chemotaxis response regulator CheB